MRTPILLQNPFVSFLWKAILWAAVALALGKAFAIYQFWIVVLSIFVLSVPIALGRIYWSTIKQISGLSKFMPSGRLHRLMSGRVIRVTQWIAWAPLVRFVVNRHSEWSGKRSEWRRLCGWAIIEGTGDRFRPRCFRLPERMARTDCQTSQLWVSNGVLQGFKQLAYLERLH